MASWGTASFLRVRAHLASNPVYKEALVIARSSGEMQELLGQPIQEGLWAFGEVRPAYGSDFAEWTTTLKGPKGRGRLHGVANHIGTSWRYSRLLFIPENGRTTLDITPSPARDTLVSSENRKKVFVVPLGAAQHESLAWMPAYYKAKFDLDVEVLPAIPLDGSVWNAARRQLAAEKLISLMKRGLPEKVRDQTAVLIGVTSGDMYIQSYDWRYAINYREDGRFGVVSTARLRPVLFFQKWNQALAISRLQKMLSKNVYLFCFDVPLSSDYTSAVSGGVMSPEEVDYMSDQVIGAEGRWDSLLTGVVPTISMVLAPEQPVVWNMEWSSKPPAEVSSEHFSANLGAGILVQRKTDFYLDGEFPLQFVRVDINQDPESREFGVGTKDSLDISIAGVPGKYLELTLENGVRTHFDRDAASDSAGGQAYQGRADYFSPFSRGRVLMHGFDSDLTAADGWRYFFPYRPTGKSEDKLTILTGYSDPRGRRFEMARNDDGDLLSVRTPEGKWLHFESDEQHRYRRIEDSEGRVVNYDYDPKGRLVRVSDSKGEAEIYRYDDKNQMREVVDGNEHVLMTITYFPDGRIRSQTLRDGRSFRYEYQKDAAGHVVQIQFTDPRDFVTVFSYVGKQYTQSLPYRTADGSARRFEALPE
jgi:YD repeat-containing protein